MRRWASGFSSSASASGSASGSLGGVKRPFSGS